MTTTPAELARIDDLLSYRRHSKERQRNRQSKLNQYAKDHGFKSWSALETAVINGEATIIMHQRQESAPRIEQETILATL